MRKKRKKQIAIGIIAVILLGIILSATGFNNPFAIGGFTSLSISKVSIDGQDYIRVYGTAQGAEGLSVTLSQSQLDQALQSSGLKSTKSIPINIRLEKQIAKFYISKTPSETFYNLNYKSIGGLFTPCGISNCGTKLSLPLEMVIGTSRSITADCTCVYKEQLGITGNFINDRKIDYSVSINVDGNTAYLTRDENVLSLANGKIKVEGLGSLNNFDQINAPTSWKALFETSQYTKMISSSAYPQQSANLESFKTTCMRVNTIPYDVNTPISTSSVVNCVNDYRNKVETYLSDKFSDYKNEDNVNYYADSSNIFFSGDYLQFNLKTPSVQPTFIIDMDADFVGIVSLKGKPQCQNPEDVNFKSGSGLTQKIEVTNIGDNAGSFYGLVNCDSGVTGTIAETFFEKGETKDMSISTSGSNLNSGTQYSSCTYKIIDRKSGDSTTCSNKVGVEFQSGIVCTPKSFRCEGNDLMTCSDDGTKFNLMKTCQYGCQNNYCVGESCKKESEVCAKNVDCCSGLTCESGKCTKPEVGGDCKSCTDWAKNFFRSEDKKCESTSLVKGNYQGFFSYFNPVNWGKSIVGTTGLTSQNIACPVFFVSIGIIIVIIIFIILIALALLGITVNLFRGSKGIFKDVFKKRK